MLKLSKQHIDKILPQDKLYSLRALKTPAAGKILAKWMVGMGILFLIVLFLPWQQNIRGTGLVTALNPGNRPQTIEAIIAGRIKHWNIREGQFVEKGDTILTITEVKEKYFDPDLLVRLKEQIQAKENGLQSKKEKTKALKRQVAALRDGMKIKIEQSILQPLKTPRSHEAKAGENN